MAGLGVSMSEPFGVVYGGYDETMEQFNSLLYVTAKGLKTYAIGTSIHESTAIFATKNDIYFDVAGKICNLFSGRECSVRGDRVLSITEHNGQLLDAGSYGVYATETDICLISPFELRKKGIRSIQALGSGPDKQLYALVRYAGDEDHGLLPVYNITGRWVLGNEILHYDTDIRAEHNAKFMRMLLLPHGSFVGLDAKIYPFTVISGVSLTYLDITTNSGIRKLKGSLVEPHQRINRLKVLSLEGSKATIVYSGDYLQGLYQMTVDLDRAEVIDGPKQWIAINTPELYAFDLVRSEKLHQQCEDIAMLRQIFAVKLNKVTETNHRKLKELVVA